MKISISCSMGPDRVIGTAGKSIPPKKDDLGFFLNYTESKAVIMGSVTADAMDFPLPGRLNIVLTNYPLYEKKGFVTITDIGRALRAAEKFNSEEALVIGGGEIFKLFLPIADQVIIEQLDECISGDITFPELKDEDWACGEYALDGFESKTIYVRK